MIGRRLFNAGLGAMVLGLTQMGEAAAARGTGPKPEPFGGRALADTVRTIEAESGGRLGLCVREAGTGRHFAWRGGERFPMCSTFKFLLASLVLTRVDRGVERLDRALPVRTSDLVSHSPVVERHVNEAMSVESLIEAMLTLSDNGAANLLLGTIGGPPALTRFARAIGDTVSRLDRIEPLLNEAAAGDPRDTTTPAAMAQDLERLLIGAILHPGSRARLADWLLACRTGGARLRAGLPEGWRIGDKTGSGEHGSTNDIAILWPPQRPPLLVAAYLTGTTAEPARREAALAAVARAVAAA